MGRLSIRKHPVSIALSKRVLEPIDNEVSKQKRSKSDWVEIHFEEVLLLQESKKGLLKG